MKFLLYAIASILITGCAKPVSPAETNNKFSGTWVNQSYIDTVAHYTKADLFRTIKLPFALQIETLNDSVLMLHNGFETYRVNYRYQTDTLQIPTMQITMLYDSVSNSLSDNKNNHWKKVTPTENTEAYIQSLNKILLAGNYKLLNNSTDDEIQFEASGKINGWLGATIYRLCIAGDCLHEFAFKGNTMVMHFKNDDTRYYGWQFIGDTLYMKQILPMYEMNNQKHKRLPTFTLLKQQP